MKAFLQENPAFRGPDLNTRLKRHPFAIKTRFRFSLVLAYAFPRKILQPLLPPGLELLTYREYGFVGIALVDLEHFRPAWLPECLGRDFFVAGYRIFVTYKNARGRTLRGLKILRSDTGDAGMAWLSNRLTHYHTHPAKTTINWEGDRLEVSVLSPRGVSDLHVIARTLPRPASLPSGSPFPGLEVARRYDGPLPFTFDYEPQTNSMLLIEGVRQGWNPEPVEVQVLKANFFHQPPFNEVADPVLANAFYIENIPYSWKPGHRENLPLD